MATSGTVAQTNFSINWSYYPMDAECYVYIDRKPCGKPFYVGIGNKRRVRDRYRKNSIHTNIVRKYNTFTRTVIEASSLDVCKELEIFIISELGRRDNGSGVLANATDGGDGTRGHVVSEEMKAKNPAKKPENRLASSIRMRSNNPMMIPEIAAKVSAALTGKKLPNEVVEKIRAGNTGKKYSDEIRKKFSIAQKGSKKPMLSINNPMYREEVRLKNSLSQKGKKLTVEHLSALRISHKGRIWAVDLTTGTSIGGKPEKIMPLIERGTHKRGRKL